jgi:hypothetical protein
MGPQIGLFNQQQNNYFNFNFNFGTTPPNTGQVSFSDILQDLANLFDGCGNGIWAGGGGCIPGDDFPMPAPVDPPVIDDSSQPSGSLKVDGNVITTAGGYKIEATGQFEWKITGPDGKETKVWGDPHVAEGDGGKWDFKKNSTFVLGDGTRINVTTAPWGDGGMTVTSKLEVISGNDRVEVTDIDKGQGKVGEITQDGFAHANSFQGDVFVMGQETDDWSYTGKEIIGSENGGDSFKLGNELKPGNPRGIDNPQNPIDDLLGYWMNNGNQLMNLIDRIFRGFGLGGNDRLGRGNRFDDGGDRPWINGRRGRNDMIRAFRFLARMFDLLSRLSSLDDQVRTNRNRFVNA